MTLSLLNKIATVGLIAIVTGAAVNIIVTIAGKNNSVSAMPITYRVMITACCWFAIAIVGCIIYFVLKKHIKA